MPDLVGRSLVPSFSGGNNGRDSIFWEHEGNRALRNGQWKLVAKGIEGPRELYDMGMDRSEQSDLAKIRPDVVDEMAAEWERIAAATHVFPLDGRGWVERVSNPAQKSATEHVAPPDEE